MARPHLEWVQSQALPWEAGLPDGRRPGLRGKTLSLDPETGDCTLLVAYPAGAEIQDEDDPADEEIFVLSGALALDEGRLGRHGYGFLPGGSRRALRSPEGALVLACRQRSRPGSDAPHVLVDSLRLPWEPTTAPHIAHLNAFRKNLRLDPAGACRTYLLAGLPQGVPAASAEPLEAHDHYSEAFLISGDLSTWVGVMRPGAYIWRPPEAWHGADATATGFFFFMRTPGSNRTIVRLGDRPHPVRLDPAHRPILPPVLEVAMREPPYDPVLY